VQNADTSKPTDLSSPSTHNGQGQTAQPAVITTAKPEPTTSLPGSPISRKSPLLKWLIWGGLCLGVTTVGISGYHWWQFLANHEETDDAYITTDLHPINARIAGTVTEVTVRDNQGVKPGTVVVRLDPRDYRVALEQAQAALAVAQEQANVARANISVTSINAIGQTTEAQGDLDAATASIATARAALSEAQAGVLVSESQLASVEANLIKARLDFERYQRLVEEGAIPRFQFDAAKATYDALVAQRKAAQEQVRQAQARVAQAQENLRNAKAKLAASRGIMQQAQATGQQTRVNQQQYQVALAAVKQAKTQVENAQLQLAYTMIAAPADGTIGNKTVQVGQRVQPGQILMTIVELHPWVIANFKETQLAEMQPGAAVEIKIDAIPGKTFLGRVDSLSPASGAKFSILPPDNATGNFTRIVQRIPVKIVFDPQSIKGYETCIRPGMSVTTTVETKR
jgi:membrane fusion protein, multidrug efflux system